MTKLPSNSIHATPVLQQCKARYPLDINERHREDRMYRRAIHLENRQAATVRKRVENRARTAECFQVYPMVNDPQAIAQT